MITESRSSFPLSYTQTVTVILEITKLTRAMRELSRNVASQTLAQ